MEKLNSISAIKKFFEADGGRKVEMSEFRALSIPERTELAKLCCAALGVELDAPSVAAGS